MDDLPELPFEKVLSYLSLRDRLRLAIVSRSCYKKVAKSRVQSLCYSQRPIGRIRGKVRWVNEAFAQNFICSTRFSTFFNAFSHSILSSLKRLRLCDLHLSEKDPTAFIRTLNSFGQLEQLDIVRTQFPRQKQFTLKLPMLTSVHLEQLIGVKKLTLDAPRLLGVKLLKCSSSLRLVIVRGESVERLMISDSNQVTVNSLLNLKNLKCLHTDRLHSSAFIDSTFLSRLDQLKAVHLEDPVDARKLFKQKQRHDRTDLKIYLHGLLLHSPNDPAIIVLRGSFSRGYLSTASFDCLAANPSRLADVVPFYRALRYSAVERVDPAVQIEVLKRFPDLKHLSVDSPVRNIQRFLEFLKNFENIRALAFYHDQPQDLFNQLPEHSTVQCLFIDRPPADLEFLFRLKHLIYLDFGWSMLTQIECIRQAFQKIPFLIWFRFHRSDYGDKARIEIRPDQRFKASDFRRTKTVFDLNAAIKFIFGMENKENQPNRPKKRKTEEMK